MALVTLFIGDLSFNSTLFIIPSVISTSLTSIMSKPFLLGNDKYFISALVIRLWLDLIDIVRVMLLTPSLSPVCTKMFTHKIHYAEHILKNTQP